MKDIEGADSAAVTNPVTSRADGARAGAASASYATAAARRRLIERVRAAPKAELHVHVEGTLEPEQLFALAQRNGVSIPYASPGALRRAYAFRDLQSFLDLYYAGAAVLRTEQDFHDLAWAYLQRAAADHVVRAEIFFDPQTHTAREVPIGAVIEGLARACTQARLRLGVDAQLILCFLRHLSEDDARRTLEAALPWRRHFIGVGLDSGERGNPPERFARVFARARALGLHVVAHAGEEGPPAYIEGALDTLRAERIDHGVRALESPALLERLARERVPLTVCPLSNTRLRVYDRMELHGVPQLLRAGALVTINSDDPAYFGGYVNDNYAALLDALPTLGEADALRMLRASLEASFADDACKRTWVERLQQAWDASA